MNSPFRILFVCMGNICRSPTAEGVFRFRAQAAGLLENLDIDSAGTHAYHVGEAPDRRSQAAARQRGYDLSLIRARQVCAADYGHFDLILAMDDDNLSLLQARAPVNASAELGLFLKYSQHYCNEAVPDPYYDGEQGFQDVLDRVEDASDGLLAWLCGELSAGSRGTK